MSKVVYWTMRNGEQIDIDKMSVSHLRNALKMVARALHKQQKKKKKQLDYHNSVVARMNISEDVWNTHFGGPYSYVDQTDFYD